MAYEFLLVGLAIMGFLVVVFRTDSSDQIVQPLVDAAEVTWEYLVDSAAARVKHAGRLIIRLGGDGLSLGIHNAGAAIWAGIVGVSRLIGQGLRFAGSTLRKYVPIVMAGLRREAARIGSSIKTQANKAWSAALVWGPIVAEWFRRNARLAGETAWVMLVKAGSGVKKVYENRTTH